MIVMVNIVVEKSTVRMVIETSVGAKVTGNEGTRR